VHSNSYPGFIIFKRLAMGYGSNFQSEFRDKVEVPPLDELVTNGTLDSETLLPVQYNDLMRRSSQVDGERKLIFAVLCVAIHDYLSNARAKRGEGRARFAEVDHWINDRTFRCGLLSYEGVCEHLGVDAERLRRGLKWLRGRLRALDSGPPPSRSLPSRRSMMS
jgi:hypothetical protein